MLYKELQHQTSDVRSANQYLAPSAILSAFAFSYYDKSSTSVHQAHGSPLSNLLAVYEYVMILFQKKKEKEKKEKKKRSYDLWFNLILLQLVINDQISVSKHYSLFDLHCFLVILL